MRNVIYVVLLLASGLISPPDATAHIREVAAGESALPPATGSHKTPVREIIEAFVKDKDAATLAYQDKPLRITGTVADFTGDYVLNQDQDVFIIVNPANAPKQDRPSPYSVYVRFSRPQLKAFGFPANKKPKNTIPHFAGAERTVNQAHTVAYFNKDLNCIALWDSETLTLPLPPTAHKGAKPETTSFVTDKIQLVSVGDSFDADVLLEQLDANGALIFTATVNPDVH